jgi:hypothetical protein
LTQQNIHGDEMKGSRKDDVLLGKVSYPGTIMPPPPLQPNTPPPKKLIIALNQVIMYMHVQCIVALWGDLMALL